jgi:DNA-binding NarL/FixJ family response regulator
MLPKIKVLLYEDNLNVREFLTDLLATSQTIQLTDTFADANKVVKQVAERQPDVVLMDIEMPGTNGLDALQQIKAAHPQTKVLMQTQHDNRESIFTALCRGASGYILKLDLLNQLEQAITRVYQGGGYLSPAVIPTVANLFKHGR